jgi:predicted transcriptional regulator
MAKDRERKLAEELYVKQRKTAKQIAEYLGITEKTVGDWVKKYGWKDRRNALMSSLSSGLDNINKVIDHYAEKLIEMESDPEAKEDAKFKLVDAMAKLNKTKENFEKAHRIPYNVYINVTESIMNEMLQKMKPAVHADLLEFFEEHINNLALKY